MTLSRDARCRALQLPAWNEALGLPRPWDQQWSLRIQQVLAYETDLLEYDDLFDGSPVVAAKVAELATAAREEMERVLAMGGAVAAVENAYMKRRLVESQTRAAARHRARRTPGDRAQLLHRDGGLGAGRGRAFDPAHRRVRRARADRASARLPCPAQRRRRAGRAHGAARRARERPERDAAVDPRAPTRASPPANGRTCCARSSASTARRPASRSSVAPAADEALTGLREEIRRLGERLGRPPKMLVGKPGLDGHSNGAEQIAVRARDVGMEVVYEGIRLTPDEIVSSARDEGVHVIGLSILSGSHGVLVRRRTRRAAQGGPRTHPRGGRRDHPRGRRRQAPRSAASRASTRRRTSTSTPSSARSRSSWRSRPLAERPDLAQRLLRRDRDAVAEALNLARRPPPRPARGRARAARRARVRDPA